jgi:glycosyltransferase involved in cell wall biosynthesis
VKVVFFIGTLQAGGLERFVTRVSLQAKLENRFEPVIICLNQRNGIFLPELLSANIQVYEAPKRWFRSPFAWWRLVRLVARINPDIVHSQVNYSILQQFLASWIAGTVFAVTERNCYKRSGIALMRRRFQYFILKLFGVPYSANSARVAQHLAVMLKEKPESFPVLPNGIDRISATTSRTVSRFRIAYVARMAPHKGHLFFLTVLEKLIYQRGLECEAWLMGDGSERSRIEQEIEKRKLSDFVTVTGVVSDVEDRLQDCDVVALLSEFEGMPNVVMEGMAAGKPVIATDVGNVQELLAGGAGIVLAHRDAERAVDAFELLIRQPELRWKMGELGRKRIETEFSLTATLNKLVHHYLMILNKP